MRELLARTSAESAMNRREMIQLAAATSVMATASVSTASAQDKKGTFILVHGAWHGGWCWRRVADKLRAAGHAVFTPTCTGLGERSHLLRAGIDLKTHIADVVNLMKW